MLLVPHRAGRAADAAAAARRFTQRWPQAAAGWGVLSESAAALGRVDEAIDAARQLVRIDNGDAQAHAELGSLLHGAGQGEAALEAYRRALEIRPADAGIRYNLASVLRDLGRFDEAVAAFREALQQRPDWPEALNNLGNALHKLSRTDEAIEALQRAAELRPRIALIHNNLGNALFDARCYDEAEAAFRRALELEPRYAEAYNNLGRVLWMLRRPSETEAAQRRAVELQPDLAEARYSLANILRELGKTTEAEAEYRQCLTYWPDDARIHYGLAQLKCFAARDADLERIEALLERPAGFSDIDRARLHYAAAKAYTDIGTDPALAFHHYSEGARHKRVSIDYDVADDEALFARIARYFPAERIRAAAEHGEGTTAPVFIVGMPRSGTTLVEQILATHSAVEAMGELPDLENHLDAAAQAAQSSLGDWLAEASPGALAAIGRAYRTSVIDAAGDVGRITDKMPENFRFAGVIAAALPHARIVHVQRDPADTCLACFRQLFGGPIDFTYDLTELGRYYRVYAQLMDHWRDVISAEQLLEVQYEEFVMEPEREIRRLLDFCGLDWEAACLEFHRTERVVQTASVDQVRQPLYTSSIGRWRIYREQLEPLLEALGPLAPGD